MRTKTKILLTISVSAFALGFTKTLWGIGAPIGAILFGLFMISKMLEKETALYDQEQKLRLAEGIRAARQIQNDNAKTPTLSMSAAVAHSR